MSRTGVNPTPPSSLDQGSGWSPGRSSSRICVSLHHFKIGEERMSTEVQANAPASPARRLAAAVGPLRVVLGSHKLVVCRGDRGDTPHLTISWGNATGQVDFHLTWERRQGKERYEPLFQIDAQALLELFSGLSERLVAAMVGAFEQGLRPVSARWLADNGYYIFVPDEAHVAQLREEFAPFTKKKYRIDVERMSQPTAALRLYEDSLYHPACLSAARRQQRLRSLLALPADGGAGLLQLVYVPNAAGILMWHATAFEDLAEALASGAAFEMDLAIGDWFNPLFLRVAQALHLEDVGLDPQHIAAVDAARIEAGDDPERYRELVELLQDDEDGVEGDQEDVELLELFRAIKPRMSLDTT
jgi:hypothetical protein